MERPGELVIACTPKREDPRDVWVGREGVAIEGLTAGAIVGTASLRRQSQLLSWRPDLVVVPLRGNIDTRLKTVAAGAEGISGTFLAAAGLIRAGLVPAHGQFLAVEKYVRAAGQGTLPIEARAGDGAILALLGKIHDAATGACLGFERAIVKALAGSCLAPIGVCAQPREGGSGVDCAGGWWRVRMGRGRARCALMAASAEVGALEWVAAVDAGDVAEAWGDGDPGSVAGRDGVNDLGAMVRMKTIRSSGIFLSVAAAMAATSLRAGAADAVVGKPSRGGGALQRAAGSAVQSGAGQGGDCGGVSADCGDGEDFAECGFGVL